MDYILYCIVNSKQKCNSRHRLGNTALLNANKPQLLGPFAGWLGKWDNEEIPNFKSSSSGCTVAPDSKETELGSSDQEASPSAGKKNRGSFSVMFAHGSASLQLFPVVWIFLRSLGVICYDR